MSNAFIVELEEQPIELCNLLKLLDLVESGGQAKMLIAEGYVGLNGELCLQKRKKVFAGDTVEFDGQLYQIALLSEDEAELQPEPNNFVENTVTTEQAEPEAKPQATSKPAKANPAKTKQKPKDKKTGRKPISFG